MGGTEGAIKVWALPPVWGTPSPSPFAIKLMTWLRMAGIRYETPPMRGPPRSSTRKVPYVELPGGELVCDSGEIIARLAADRGIDLDRGLDDVQRATGHAVGRMLEEHLYFVGLWERWATAEGFQHTARDYFRHLPRPVAFLLPRLLRRRIRRYLHGQGLGRLPPASILARARADLRALSRILAEREFVLGALSTVDATAYGLLCALLSHPWDSAVARAVREHPNLVDYTERMRVRYWPGDGAQGPT